MATTSQGIEYSLYGGQVRMLFNPNSPKYRYTVTDSRNRKVVDKPIRGVTSILKDIIAKPDLMTWPMNMANQVLFGNKFDETLLDYTHDWSKALLKPDTPFTADELHNMMLDGSREWTKRSDQGKDVGTLVHSAIEAYLKKEKFSLPEDLDPKEEKMVRKAEKAFKDWWESLESKRVIELERAIYSRALGYAGTLDLVAEINGKIYVLDIKTTNVSKKAPMGIYAEYFLQLGGYSFAHREETGLEAYDLGVIRVGKDGKLHIATANDIGLSRDHCERAFAFAVRLHDFLETATPYLADARFRSHLIRQPEVEQADSISN